MDAVAVGRHIVLGIIACRGIGAVGGCQQTGALAVGRGNDIVGHGEFFVGLVLEIVGHDLLPDNSGQTVVVDAVRLVIAHPARESAVG